VAVTVLKSCEEAEEYLQRLRLAGFDLSSLSVVAADRNQHKPVVAYYSADGPARVRNEHSALWNRITEALPGWAVFVVPEIGLVLTAGPLGGWIVAALESAVVVGNLSPLGAALYGLGIPKETVQRYEAAVTAGRVLLIAHGAAEEVGIAREILS
jgi:Heat induced stress protein YflT